MPPWSCRFLVMASASGPTGSMQWNSSFASHKNRQRKQVPSFSGVVQMTSASSRSSLEVLSVSPVTSLTVRPSFPRRAVQSCVFSWTKDLQGCAYRLPSSDHTGVSSRDCLKSAVCMCFTNIKPALTPRYMTFRLPGCSVKVPFTMYCEKVRSMASSNMVVFPVAVGELTTCSL